MIVQVQLGESSLGYVKVRVSKKRAETISSKARKTVPRCEAKGGLEKRCYFYIDAGCKTGVLCNQCLAQIMLW